MPTLNQCIGQQDFEILHLKKHELTPKLMEMGLYPGKRVRILFFAPLGDPMAVDVEGYTLSLRREEAAIIQVRSLS
ncbi:MAG: ferrous iron transport protein A [Bernardetiaceae bacterium]